MSTMTSASQVSEHILSPLRRIARRHTLLVGVRCLLQLVTIGLLVLLAIAMLLGNFRDLTLWLRIPIVLLTWSGIVVLGYYAIRPIFHGWSVDRAALEIEHSLPHVQERISSAVELSSDNDARYRGSESLISHLIGQAEEDAGNIQPQMVVRPKGLLIWSAVLVPVLAVWTIAVLARPLTMEAGLFRVFMPWKAQLPAFLASISVTPGNAALDQGNPLTITLNVSPEAGSISDAPGQATLVKRFTSGQILSQDLNRTGKLQFAATLSNIEQGFSYRIDSAAGQSPWYTVTVNARPAITGIDLFYEYPKYTGIAPKIVSAPDGAIDAVIGTKVGITVHATQELGQRSRLTLDPGAADAADLPLTQTVPGKNDYQATLLVHNTGVYHFVLVNTVGLQGIADETRTITARPDEPPTIAIVSPHQARLAVRADDVVPIHYRAGDDFGVEKIKALIAVDNKEIPPFELIFDPTDRRDIKGEYDLAVPAILKLANVESARRITYQFQAWDSRDPSPQSALTAKQSLTVSEQPIRSYEARIAAEDANHLTQAIQEAIRKLQSADERVHVLQQAEVTRPFRPDERRLAEEIKNQITKTATDLTNAADDAMSSEMANVAAQAQDIAAHPITNAAGSVAKAQLDADAGTQRQQDVDAARTQTADAIKQLRALLDTVKKTEQRSEAARDLADAAKDQQKAAQDMAQHPDQTAKNQQEQQKADQELQQAMKEDPGLKQDQQAQSTADKLAALQQKIDALHDQQNATAQATAQQKAPDTSKIAAAQKALNEQIQQFEKQQQDKLQQAQTTPPPAEQQNQIVNDLNNNQAASAAQKMQNAADQLNSTAQKLQQASATTQPFTPQQQNQLTADQQAQTAAKNAQNQAEQAAAALNQQTQQPGASDPTIQQAQQAAQAIQQQAQNMQAQGNDATDSQNSAEQQAQQAETDAQAAQNAATPAEATKDMQQAAQALRHAANALVQAQQQNAADQQQAMQQQQAQASQQAAAQAQTLAQQQQALLQQDQPNEQAAKDESAQQQQIAQTAQNAQQLQQAAQADQDNDVAQRAADAQNAVQQAANEAQQAANAEHNNQPDQAAQHETQSAHQLALADNALRGQPPAPQVAQNDQPTDPHQPMDDQQQQNQQAQPDQQEPSAQQNQQGQQQDQSQQNQQGQQQQGQQSQQAQNQEQGQQQGQQAGQQQGQQQSADAAHHDAADAADEAQHAQEQASHSQGQQAQQSAQEAANELAKASEKMEDSVPGQEDQGHNSGPPHQGMQANSQQGSSATPGDNKPLPASVLAIGISARTWAKLPALAQQDLLNASQQNSLPAYRESIKNYFEKIARLKDSTTSQQQGTD